MTESPWMTLAETCTYSRKSYETVRRAAVGYQRTSGRAGLKGEQPRVNACWTFHRDDVDRWIKGEPPVAPARSRLRRAS